MLLEFKQEIFLGFLVHQRGVEVDQNKAKAIISAKAPKNKKELQKFLGKVNYLRRFISNLARKTKVFSNLIKLKKVEEFKWEKQHHIAFDGIKGYLSKPSSLRPSLKGRPLKLYLLAAKESIGCLLAQNNDEGHEQAVYYLRNVLNSIQTRYTPIEKLCLALYFACTKLRHYLIKSQVYVVSQTNLMKYMLIRPLIIGRIGKWSLSLPEFTLVYFPYKSVKGQALANFLVDYPSLEIQPENDVELKIYEVERRPWILKFDGSSMEKSVGESFHQQG